MSVIPDWADAIGPNAVHTLLSGEPLPKNAINAGLDAAPNQAVDVGGVASARREQASADKETRAKIQSLSAADKDTFDKAVPLAQQLIGIWSTGALQGAAAFHSSLVKDQSVFSPALAGNLMWAATSIEGVGAKVLLSFVGASAGSLAFQSDYSRLIGPVIGDVATHLNQLHDDMFNRADVLIYPAVMQEGLVTYSKLDVLHQNMLIWNALFSSVRSDSGNYTNPTRDYVLGNLQSADREASEKLAFYRQVWDTSLEIIGNGFDGTIWAFSQVRWGQQTEDPVWLWAGHDVSLDQFTGPGGDPCTDQNMRAAALLRVAINRLWPVNP